jgi:hypothetical protein
MSQDSEDSFVENAGSPDDDRPDDLDGLRIRKIAHAKQSAYRSLSWMLIGGLFCVVAVGRLGWEAWAMARRGSNWIAVGYVLAVGLCAWMGAKAFARAAIIRREARKSALEEPGKPPDFSTLGDGQAAWRRLDEIQDDDQ